MTDRITRMEVIDAVGAAFGAGAPGRDELVAAARRAGARPEVIKLLSALPAGRFRQVRDLWIDLRHLPLGV